LADEDWALMPTLTSTQLAKVSEALLKAAGASDEEASVVTKFLVKANLVGVDSHGVLPNLIFYIKGVRNGVIKPGAKFAITRETVSSALVNGNWGFGQVICSKAMQIAIDKAKKTGVGVVGIFNCNHIGRLADYTQMALENGMIGFIACNSDPCVAPYGGRKIVLSTNPLSYGIPAGKEKPIIVDFATSMAAEGKIRTALYKGQQLPSGWIVDSRGQPSTDPADLYEPPLPPEQIKLAGAILPAGGHKGYGLGLVMEILGGALTGTGCSEEVTPGLTNGVFITVVKIDQFVPLQDFKARIDRLIRTIKNSPKAEGFGEILIPGEPELREEEKRSKSGIIIPEAAWMALVDACREYGIDPEKLIHA
jgi:uncharacterized oxidoreductase